MHNVFLVIAPLFIYRILLFIELFLNVEIHRLIVDEH